MVVNGPATNDTLVLKNNGGTLQYTLNGGAPVNLPAGMTNFTFNGANGFTNAFTLDYTGGVFVLPGGITFRSTRLRLRSMRIVASGAALERVR